MTLTDPDNRQPVINFNDAVWSSQEMAEANRAIQSARVELSAEGWGFIALEGAQKELARAIQLIETMKHMQQSDRRHIAIANPVTVVYTINARLGGSSDAR